MKKYIYLFLILFIGVLSQCSTYKQKNTQSDKTVKVDLNSSPVLSPAESMKRMQLEDGFEVKLVASEPLVNTPVAITFDAKGRIWVLEMEGYMPDSLGTGEEIPAGKIVILEDKNKDGVADTRKIFLDSLLLPRAFSMIENGILVAEPPNLWYYEINNDKPGKKVLVDDKYTQDGNVEHFPNGLLRTMDNWIYNAKSDKRYRKKGDKWLIEKTYFRGQWGISQDNYGRLYYNDNSTNLLGDYFNPGFGAGNKNQRGIAGYNERSVPDNKVYPLRPNSGVNRGYQRGILDDSLRLVNFTAACGPLIYRGDLFGKMYESNAFVAEPSANLIKRNILEENGFAIKGTQAYKGREFLSSTDERFRPVNLYDGPDGALYIVDLYRGIIQHKTYLTPYLKGEIAKRNLTQPITYGRIYKIVPKAKKSKPVLLPTATKKLVPLLGHANGWVRDKAQQLLVDNKDSRVIPALRSAAKQTDNPLLTMHALWTLEGLDALKTEEVLGLLNQPLWPVRMQALSVLPSVINQTSYKQYTAALEGLITQGDDLAAPYIGFVTRYIQPFDKILADNMLKSLAKKYPDNRYVAAAVVGSIEGREEAFQKELLESIPDKNLAVNRQLQTVITAMNTARNNRDPQALAREFPKGAAIFNSTCQTCHNIDGSGRASLAPPLNRSEWVTGNKERLISIALLGMTGPVTVNGYVYKAPEISGDMPGIGYSKEFTDDDIAQLLSFVRRSWQNNADRVTSAEVTSIRQKLKDRQKAFTAEELNKL